MVGVGFALLETTKTFSKITVPFHIPTSNVRKLLLHHNLVNSLYNQSFSF